MPSRLRLARGLQRLRRATRKAKARLKPKKTVAPTTAAGVGEPVGPCENFHIAQEAMPVATDSQCHTG